MPETTDRSIRDNRLLLGAIIFFIAVASGAGIYLWSRMGGSAESGTPAAEDRLPRMQLIRLTEPLTVTLYYPFDGRLARGEAAVKRQPDTQSQAREAVASLFADQRASAAAALRDVKLRELYVDALGTAYVDLSPSQRKDVKASVEEELLAVYAVVNTLTQNFEEIRQVRILLDGKEAQTLAGHVDLSRPLTKRMDLVKQ
ncbi:MAG TPA: GerMN domain-containing protein [Nitrospirota bacterium]